MLLTSIRAKNFLSFASFSWGDDGEIDPRLNVLIGPNGAGKTNVFNLVRAMVDVLDFERPVGWDHAAHRGRDERALRVELGIEFNTGGEQRLLCSFLRAAFCNEEHLNALIPRAMPTALARLSSFVQARLNPADIAWLFAGRLVIVSDGRGRWTSWYESVGNADRFHLNLDESPYSALSRPHEGGTQVPAPISRVWWDLLPEDGKAAALRYLEGEMDEYPAPPDIPAMLADRRTLELRVRSPNALYVPALTAFEREANITVLPGRDVEARSVFGQLLRRGVIFTDNVRRDPDYAFPAVSLNEAIRGLSSGEQLAAYLYRKKNGDARDRAGYRAIGRLFERLTGRTFDIGHAPAPSAEELIAAGRMEGDERLTLTVGSDYGDVPLRQSGAGRAEALYLAAVVAGSAGSVVLLDEPAQNLHPNMQTTLLDEIGEMGGSQFFLVTHAPTMLPIRRIDTVSRFALRDGQTHRASLSRARWNPNEWAAIERQLRLSADARALLFSRGVVLVEGETELGALPVWYEKTFGMRPEQADITFHRVGGEQEFGLYVKFLEQLEVPWVVVCDGRAIGPLPATDPNGASNLKCLIARGLRDAHVGGVSDAFRRNLETRGFAERKEALKAHGVFTIAEASSGERENFEGLAVVRARSTEAQALLHSNNKPLVGRYIAETYPCPPEVDVLLHDVVAWLKRESARGDVPGAGMNMVDGDTEQTTTNANRAV